MYRTNWFTKVAVLLLTLCVAALAQDFEYPAPSPASMVSQTVGITKVSIDYSSPGVKGRTIWGGLVPYGETWRTGANAPTKLSISTDVKLNGQDLAAGDYNVTTLPGESEWKVMFESTESETEETTYALELSVKPTAADFLERMTFLIENNTNDAADIVLHWEKLRLTLNMEVNTTDMVLKAANREVNGTWRPPFQAANYVLSNDLDAEQGLKWATQSVKINKLYWNMRIKAQLEAKLGKTDDAVKTMSAAIELGEKMDNAPFDFDRMKGLLAEWQGTN